MSAEFAIALISSWGILSLLGYYDGDALVLVATFILGFVAFDFVYDALLPEDIGTREKYGRNYGFFLIAVVVASLFSVVTTTLVTPVPPQYASNRLFGAIGLAAFVDALALVDYTHFYSVDDSEESSEHGTADAGQTEKRVKPEQGIDNGS